MCQYICENTYFILQFLVNAYTEFSPLKCNHLNKTVENISSLWKISTLQALYDLLQPQC